MFNLFYTLNRGEVRNFMKCGSIHLFQLFPKSEKILAILDR